MFCKFNISINIFCSSPANCDVSFTCEAVWSGITVVKRYEEIAILITIRYDSFSKAGVSNFKVRGSKLIVWFDGVLEDELIPQTLRARIF